MKYEALDQNIFIENRKRFIAQMEPNSIAIFHSNDQMPRNGDSFFTFRQNSDLFYLSGIDQEKSILVLYPSASNPDMREMLFLLETNEHIEIWEGHKYTKEEAQQTSGIKSVHWEAKLSSVLNELILKADTIYVNTNENDRFSSPVASRDNRHTQTYKTKYPGHKFLRSASILKKLRMIKSDREVAVMQKAVDITEIAFRRVLEFVQPGVTEYEIEAEITHRFLSNRASGHAYDPIIASGYNACVLHYVDNNMKCKEGDVILMDFGAEYGNYAADLSRSIPVNGKFTERQAAVYQACLNVFKGAREMLRPGNNLTDYHVAVGELMQEQLVNIGLISTDDIKNQNKALPAYKKYFMHGTSHHLGLDVHDLGDRGATFQEGMVFTCEPGIYIRDESLGIRIENDILITADGPRDLMANIPIEIEEIEALMTATKTVGV